MKIEQLTLENFKCFKSEKTFDFSRLTILTGANSSGKSSVMQAILMILQSEGFPDELSTNGKYVNLGDFKEISYNHRRENNVQIGFSIRTSFDSSIEKTITKWKEDKKDLLPKLVYFRAFYSNSLDRKNKSIMTKEGVHETFFQEWYNEKTINYVSAFRQSPQRTYLEQNKGDFKIGTEGEGYLDQIIEWEKRANGKITELIKTMKELDLIEDIKTKRLGGSVIEVLVKPTNSNLLTSLANVGFGVSQFLPILVADLQLPNDSTLFLAEPEIHLHPSVQSKFGEYIVNQISNSEKNYVIETHSEYFLNRIRLAIVKGELKKEDVKVYFLENNEEDTDVYDIDFTTTGAIKNAPKNFFETYFVDSMEIALNSFAE